MRYAVLNPRKSDDLDGCRHAVRTSAKNATSCQGRNQQYTEAGGGGGGRPPSRWLLSRAIRFILANIEETKSQGVPLFFPGQQK